MKHFSTKQLSVKQSAEVIYNKFSDFNNFKDMLPVEKMDHFDCTASTCKFTLKGMPEICLNIIENIPDQKVVYATQDQKPIDIRLGFDIDKTGTETSEITLYIDADIDGVTAMMLSKPLQNMLDKMAEKIS
ncbi:MAG: hypothetical protein PHU62_01285 [Bacteroidales bacterium]|jgi:hypothetical protein|nr:hypothetical protein [Bacteroidales bacterium]MDD2204005.1 hypothetical protein [Bacteroidales bacterium]MDD3913406.1 hypothetical protein [Bacteroidales bacterium]MDD4633202.1 hypothetical protein [Bacteroidales bacterium]